MALGPPRAGHSRRFLVPAFGVISVLFAVANLAAMYRAREIRERTQAIVKNTLAGIELVSRIGRDLDHVRLLVDAHIFERDVVVMERVEASIAREQADLRAAAKAYEPLAALTDAAPAWENLKDDIAATEAPIAKALAFSRQNRDVEARRAVVALDPRFAATDTDIARLIDISRHGADQALAQIDALQRSSIEFLAGLALIGIVMTLIVGTSATRLVLRRERQLQRYSMALEDRNRDLDAFAGRVAHDLRGPLTTVSLAAGRLSERAPEEAGTTALLQRAVKRMEVLIEDLLALSRIDVQVRGGVCDPALSAAEILEELGPRLQSEAATLRLAVEPARVRVGEGLLRQVLWNLVDNALKYRRRGVLAEVEVRGRVVGNQYELRVSDNGTGMSPDEARQAFEPFYRALRARETPGTGLGLSIVKRVIEVSGGTISIDTQLGRGTTFVISLPLASSAGHDATV